MVYHECRPILPPCWTLGLDTDERGGQARYTNITHDDGVGRGCTQHEREGEPPSHKRQRRHVVALTFQPLLLESTKLK